MNMIPLHLHMVLSHGIFFEVPSTANKGGSINIPQLTFSVSSPSPGFSYLINQLSFPLSEEVKRDIRFPFQRLCKQLASLLCGHNMLSWKTLVGTFVWGGRQKVKMKKDNGKVCLKRDFITMVFWGEQWLPVFFFFFFSRNHGVFFSQKIKKIPWQPLLSSKHHSNKLKINTHSKLNVNSFNKNVDSSDLYWSYFTA